MSRPDRLFRNGRFNDAGFLPEERLYFRIRKDYVFDGEKIDVTQIRSPDFSVNREKYSLPEDVLIDVSAPDFHIACFQVSDIPLSLEPSGGGAFYEFRAEHDPDDTLGKENYAHSEVRSFKNQRTRTIKSFDRKVNLPKSVKLKFRKMIGDKTIIIQGGS